MIDDMLDKSVQPTDNQCLYGRSIHREHLDISKKTSYHVRCRFCCHRHFPTIPGPCVVVPEWRLYTLVVEHLVNTQLSAPDRSLCVYPHFAWLYRVLASRPYFPESLRCLAPVDCRHDRR